MENTQNTVSLATAIDWLCRWRKEEGTYNAHNSVKGFNIPLNDLVNLTNELGVDHVRAYIGVTPEMVEKIVLVAVDAQGNDMLNADLGQYIYDMITPCPPDCGTGQLSDIICPIN